MGLFIRTKALITELRDHYSRISSQGTVVSSMS